MAESIRNDMQEHVYRKAVSMRFLSDIVYRKKAKAGKETIIDTPEGNVRVLLYGFDSPEVKPVYFDMHGGGFVMLHADTDEQMNVLTEKAAGVKIVSIDYAKAPEHPYPQAVKETYAVVKYFHDHASEYGIDPERMGVGGHSAGANLATVLCLMAQERKEFGLKLQVLDYPPLDLATDPHEKPYPKGAIPPKMAAMFNACYVSPEHAKDPYVSPIFAKRAQLEGMPPTLLILAGGDSLHDEGLRYAERLKEADVSVEVHDFSGVAHGFTYKQGKESEEARTIINEFIRRHIYTT